MTLFKCSICKERIKGWSNLDWHGYGFSKYLKPMHWMDCQYHNRTAFNCRYWTGDRKGYKFDALCKECND